MEKRDRERSYILVELVYGIFAPITSSIGGRKAAPSVNTIGHQSMQAFDTIGSAYSLIHLLEQHSGGAPFQDVLIIGAGSSIIPAGAR